MPHHPSLPASAAVEPAAGLTDTGVHRAMRQQEFTLHYQPIVSAGTRQVHAVEALLRWPRGRAAAPLEAAEFLPVAERSGLIVDLGDWVLRSACAQFDAWRREGQLFEYVAVNVSPRQLLAAGYAGSVLTTLRSCQMRPEQLQLEFNAALLEGDPALLPALRELAHHGVRLALDDCGARFDPRHALALLPLVTFKLDAACVASLPADAALRDFLRELLACARAGGCRLVAEGVESEEQLDYLEHAGCDAMQGFLLAPPLPAEAVAGVVREVAASPRLVA
jgi:EAL domain-containing protein (putative c-di-GMP-specific phosphodiesterase class I)